ncbi:SH3 domain-containing protein [Chloroflexi bacterium TSY]|nr:SH3 domain-containing protein [Chloroflexi bacterium TSY]
MTSRNAWTGKVSGYCNVVRIPASPTPISAPNVDELIRKINGAQISTRYTDRSKSFAQSLVRVYDQFNLPEKGITKSKMNEVLMRRDVGNRINALVQRVWSDWINETPSDRLNEADPSNSNLSPFKQLVVRMIQGGQLRLTGTEQLAIYNFFTRPESLSALENNMNGVIAAVNREVFGVNYQAARDPSSNSDNSDDVESAQPAANNNDLQPVQSDSQQERQPNLIERPIGQVVAIVDFETFGRWKRGDEPWGTFVQTAEERTGGQYAGRFTYDFPIVDNNYVVFQRSININGRPDALRIQTLGDGSTHFLNAWVQDANNQLWQFTFGRINHIGWETMFAPLDLSLGWPNQAIGNSSATELVYPIRLHALVLDGYTDDQTFQGIVYVDDLDAVTFADSPNFSTTNTSVPATGSSPEIGGAVAIITVNRLNVRSGPGTNYQIIGKVTRGQALPVIQQDAAVGWLQVQLPGAIGWVSDQYVRIDSSQSTVQSTASQPVTSESTASTTRSRPATQAASSNATESPIAAPSGGPLTGRIAFPAFVDGAYSIYLVNADGSNPQRVIGNASQPALSYNGQRLAFRYWKHDERRVAVMNTYGGDLRRLSTYLEDGLPAWAPSGDTIVFFSRREGDRKSRIYQASVSGRNDWEIKRDRDTVRGEYPVWMPDGCILYRATRPQIALTIMNNDGANPIPIVADGDATALYFAHRSIDSLYVAPRWNWEIYRTDLGGSSPVRLTSSSANDGLPAWSPDGQSIAFATDRNGYWAIWVMNADGSNQRELLAIPGSLDGRVPNEPDFISRGWTEERISWSR